MGAPLVPRHPHATPSERRREGSAHNGARQPCMTSDNPRAAAQRASAWQACPYMANSVELSKNEGAAVRQPYEATGFPATWETSERVGRLAGTLAVRTSVIERSDRSSTDRARHHLCWLSSVRVALERAKTDHGTVAG